VGDKGRETRDRVDTGAILRRVLVSFLLLAARVHFGKEVIKGTDLIVDSGVKDEGFFTLGIGFNHQEKAW